jgi:hypothetical protein
VDFGRYKGIKCTAFTAHINDMSSGKSNNSFSCFMHERQLIGVYGRIGAVPLFQQHNQEEINEVIFMSVTHSQEYL